MKTGDHGLYKYYKSNSGFEDDAETVPDQCERSDSREYIMPAQNTTFGFWCNSCEQIKVVTSSVDLFVSEISFYPNPASDYMRFTNADQINSVAIYNIHGQLMESYIKPRKLDISFYPEGIYLIEINRKVKRKLIKH